MSAVYKSGTRPLDSQRWSCYCRSQQSVGLRRPSRPKTASVGLSRPKTASAPTLGRALKTCTTVKTWVRHSCIWLCRWAGHGVKVRQRIDLRPAACGRRNEMPLATPRCHRRKGGHQTRSGCSSSGDLDFSCRVKEYA